MKTVGWYFGLFVGTGSSKEAEGSPYRVWPTTGLADRRLWRTMFGAGTQAGAPKFHHRASDTRLLPPRVSTSLLSGHRQRLVRVAESLIFLRLARVSECTDTSYWKQSQSRAFSNLLKARFSCKEANKSVLRFYWNVVLVIWTFWIFANF